MDTFLNEEHLYLAQVNLACLVRQRLILKQIDTKLINLLEPFLTLQEWHAFTMESGFIAVVKERHVLAAYRRYFRALQTHAEEVREELEGDELRRHVIMTECKLASGQWVDIPELVTLPRNHFYSYRPRMTQLMRSLDPKHDIKQYVAVVSALGVLNRSIQRLDQWLEQKAQYERWSRRIADIEAAPAAARSPALERAMSVQAVPHTVPMGSLLRASSVDTFRRMRFMAQEPADLKRIVFLQGVQVNAIGHRLLVMLPTEVLICRPVGCFAGFKAAFFPQSALQEHYVASQRFAVGSLSSECRDGRWHARPGLRVAFESASAMGIFIGHLQDALLE